MMNAAVTGAWSYLGRYVVRELLERGAQVVSLSSRTPPDPDPFQGSVQARPLRWDSAELTASLAGVDTLYNTYWVRHDRPPIGHRGPWTSHSEAVQNSCMLLDAAKAAGVQRIVHVSITQPSADSRLTYFRGKAQVEAHLRGTGLSHAILRPSCFFGGGDILINNVAWAVRRMPFFPLPGPLDYRIRPMHVVDMAQAICNWGEREDNATRDACGPDQYRFADLVRYIGHTVAGKEPRILTLPTSVCLRLYQAAGLLLRDTILSRAELEGLSQDLLGSDEEPLGTTALSEWVARRADTLGREFHPEPPR
ncbi:MAG: NAD(P)H-binding protein [Caldilineaceae bacterium SB0666_bin_21]|nr:NAD(P)H-binding protein [Caldilineaceae bacterium SB0666_bin_21]